MSGFQIEAGELEGDCPALSLFSLGALSPSAWQGTDEHPNRKARRTRTMNCYPVKKYFIFYSVHHWKVARAHHQQRQGGTPRTTRENVSRRELHIDVSPRETKTALLTRGENLTRVVLDLNYTARCGTSLFVPRQTEGIHSAERFSGYY